VSKKRKDGGLTHQSADFYLAAARRFARWLSKKASVAADVFDGLPGFDPSRERVHPRREVSPDELARVLEAARDSARSLWKLSGPARYHVPLTAFGTGFRAGELAALHPEHFHLHADPQMVSLPAKAAKNKKAVRFPWPRVWPSPCGPI